MSVDISSIKARSKLGRVRGFGPLWSEVDALVAEVERLMETPTLDAAERAVVKAAVRWRHGDAASERTLFQAVSEVLAARDAQKEQTP